MANASSIFTEIAERQFEFWSCEDPTLSLIVYLDFTSIDNIEEQL